MLMIRLSYRSIRPSNAAASPRFARSTSALTSGVSRSIGVTTGNPARVGDLGISMPARDLLERAEIAPIVHGDDAEVERVSAHRQIYRSDPHIVHQERGGADRLPAERHGRLVDLIM